MLISVLFHRAYNKYMAFPDIPSKRLSNQHLIGGRFDTPEAAVWWLGAVQAQDYQGAKWALAQRVKNTSSAGLDELFNQGRILRTHVLRPTWHFVMPEDIRWMLYLTAPRVKAILAYYDRKLEIDTLLLKRVAMLFTGALQGHNYLTRSELSDVLKSNGITANGQRLSHIVMHAELDGIICSGPLRGKQFTYALLDERAPPARVLKRDEALAELTKRYFISHGPATVQDFAWWSGLTVADARHSVEMAKSQLTHRTINTKTYWMGPATPIKKEPTIHLLPNYDEYLISYKDYSPIFSGEVRTLSKPFGNALLAHIIVRDGLVIGGWKRTILKDELIMRLDLLVKLSSTEQAALEQQAERYCKFLDLPKMSSNLHDG